MADKLPSRSPAPGLSAGSQTIEADLCIIGAGSGGLSVAAAAAQTGARVVLIEKHKMGGDCLNYGCVPSKALIAAAWRAHTMRSSGAFGIRPVEPVIDHAAVHNHVQDVIAAIAPNDSVERFTGLGVQVIQSAARFLDPATVMAGDTRIVARRFVVATGSSPAIPPIPGLDQVPYLTNETIFANQQPLPCLVVIGGGPIGLELAQAHRRLGSQVTVIEGARALGKEDPELTSVVLSHVRAEGVVIREGAVVERVSGGPGRILVDIAEGGSKSTVEGTHVLVAAGRKANVADLGLDAAGIKYDRRGIEVDAGLTTSNRRVYAIGDVIGGYQFTHVANYHAGIVFRRALLRLPAKVSTRHIPWVTYTDPEIANVGLSEEAARKLYGRINVYRWPYHENDRAQAERAIEGFIKVIADRKNRILGCAIVGKQAGELIQMWSLAISKGMSLSDMTQWISPYPTLSEISKRAAFRIYADTASRPLVRRIFGLLRRLP